ncbi:MAG: hypothetical protein QM770_02480 [Tepidisphaeraceae bacterium]
MRRVLALSAAILSVSAVVRADDTVVQSKVQSIGLFKNGLAVVERTVEVGGGSFRIEDVPTPVHGTFFIESTTPVTARVTTVLADAEVDPNTPLQDRLAGKQVSIRVRDQEQPVNGTVAAIEPTKQNNWNRRYEEFNRGGWYFDPYGNRLPMQPQAGRFLSIDRGDEQVLVDQSTIISIAVRGGEARAKQRKPVLVLQLPDGAAKQTVRISYLTKGIAWAPSYHVKLVDDTKLTVTQNAAIRNELMDLADVDVSLISGYPSIDFSHVNGLLSPDQQMATFFQQLASRPSQAGGGAMVQSQVVSNIRASSDGADALPPPDESVDVHYQPIGKQSLGAGDALALDVGTGEASYERLVEWTLPDPRDDRGAYYDQYRRQQDPDRFDDTAWDAVRFKNPLPFPMTTAPAMFTQANRFLGQQMSTWVNAQEQTTLRITKALSIHTRAVETEDPKSDRTEIWIAGSRYQRVTIDGELNLTNLRKTESRIIIHRLFSGDLVNADGEPKLTLQAEGSLGVNRRNDLAWELKLAPGEAKTLKYRYTVLTPR